MSHGLMKHLKWGILLFILAAAAGLFYWSHFGGGVLSLRKLMNFSYPSFYSEHTGWVRAPLYLAALIGNPEAQYTMAQIYYTGEKGAPPDYVKAFMWAQKSADKGNPSAQVLIGTMYCNGVGVSRDPVKAFRWMNAAAKQNLAEADMFLSQMYEQGLGVPRNETQALVWDLKAAGKGSLDPLAMVRLGRKYEEGQGTQRDLVEAYKWYKLAARDKAVQPTAHKALEKLRKAITPMQIAEGQRRYEEYLKSHAIIAQAAGGASR